jgi:hypothetical protein
VPGEATGMFFCMSKPFLPYLSIEAVSVSEYSMLARMTLLPRRFF